MRITSYNCEEAGSDFEVDDHVSRINFSDGSYISFAHEHICCETNYADFSVLDVFYHGEEFDHYSIAPATEGFLLILHKIPGRPTEYKDYPLKTYIPCYSEGHYSDDLDIYVTDPDGQTKCVLSLETEEIDDLADF